MGDNRVTFQCVPCWLPPAIHPSFGFTFGRGHHISRQQLCYGYQECLLLDRLARAANRRACEVSFVRGRKGERRGREWMWLGQETAVESGRPGTTASVPRAR